MLYGDLYNLFLSISVVFFELQKRSLCPVQRFYGCSFILILISLTTTKVFLGFTYRTRANIFPWAMPNGYTSLCAVRNNRTYFSLYAFFFSFFFFF